MPVFESPEALQAHRVVSQRVRDLEVVQRAAGRVERLLASETLWRNHRWLAEALETTKS